MIYSKDRILYPMKRVDFDPNGARNPQNRGTSAMSDLLGRGVGPGRVRTQARQAGARPGAIMNGSVPIILGQYRLLAEPAATLLQQPGMDAGRPQSGQLGRLVLGRLAPLGPHLAQWRRRDLFDGRGLPEELRDDRVLGRRSGGDRRVYGAHEGTTRRQWLKDLGIKCIHIDPTTTTPPPAGRQVLAPRPAPTMRWCWRSPMSDHRGIVRQGLRRDAHPRFETWRAHILARMTVYPRRRNGRKARPASRQGSAGVGARVGDPQDLSRGRGISASAAPAAPRRAPTGRAHGVPDGMQGLGKPGINMGACSRARRSIPASTSPAMRGGMSATCSAPR